MQKWIICLFGCLASCLPARLVSHALPDTKDINRFPLHHFSASDSPKKWIYTPCELYDSSFLSPHTVAFLIVQNDHLVFEYYADSSYSSCPFNVFSISKAIVGCMVGIAIHNGYIHDSNDSIGQYLPQLPPDYHNIRIRDLLDMQTGLRCSAVATALLYYSPNIERTMTTPHVIHHPGTIAEYSNHATQLLMAIVENATNCDFLSYFHQNLWFPIYPENSASWSLDSRKHGMARAFCGLNITPRDLAKFGQIYLHNDNSIIPKPWIDSTFLEPTNRPLSSDSKFPYRNQWRICSNDNEIIINGLLGQHLYINKQKNLIIIRMGKKRDKVDWVNRIRNLALRF